MASADYLFKLALPTDSVYIADNAIRRLNNAPIPAQWATDATTFNCPNILRFIINKGANVGNALVAAVMQRRTAIASILLICTSPVNERDETRRTPLMIAVMNRDIDIVQLLLTKGADTTCRDLDNNTALDYAVASGNETIRELIKTASIAQQQRPFTIPRSVIVAKCRSHGLDELETKECITHATQENFTLEQIDSWASDTAATKRNTALLIANCNRVSAVCADPISRNSAHNLLRQGCTLSDVLCTIRITN
jgi:ankyrin repeat protein